MAKTKQVPALRIVPLTGRPSYRAIGRVFPQKATDIPVADLSAVQIKRLRADPWLSVTDVQIDQPVPDADDTGSGATGGDGAPPVGGEQK
ncbi:hypothetical protein DF052_26530 [Burkholderia glumae]|uniref:hypothetical protein n=1 Tax=Burkholderia glumae TaxID=337 RepID=UPI000F5EB3DD|nr:hypothetical protein [Burkholderia glumae]RQZ65522.1 hypothetical protein DF052_26530 [Burkholderia glumae]